MSENHYFSILQFLHCCDVNEQTEDADRLKKIRPILEIVRNSFQTCLRPFQKLVIDESLMLYKGRLTFKQYIPSKRSRFGIKLFVLCDCKTGTILDFIVYTGTDIDIPNLSMVYLVLSSRNCCNNIWEEVIYYILTTGTLHQIFHCTYIQKILVHAELSDETGKICPNLK